MYCLAPRHHTPFLLLGFYDMMNIRLFAFVQQIPEGLFLFVKRNLFLSIVFLLFRFDNLFVYLKLMFVISILLLSPIL